MDEQTINIEFIYDYSQVYLYDADNDLAARNYNDYLLALRQIHTTHVSIGKSNELVDILMPRQENIAAALRIELFNKAPTVDINNWDHIIEFDINLPSGKLILEGSGGSGKKTVSLEDNGKFRARWCGKNFEEAILWNWETECSPDSYSLELWPARHPSAIQEIKRWPKYQEYFDSLS